MFYRDLVSFLVIRRCSILFMAIVGRIRCCPEELVNPNPESRRGSHFEVSDTNFRLRGYIMEE